MIFPEFSYSGSMSFRGKNLVSFCYCMLKGLHVLALNEWLVSSVILSLPVDLSFDGAGGFYKDLKAVLLLHVLYHFPN